MEKSVVLTPYKSVRGAGLNVLISKDGGGAYFGRLLETEYGSFKNYAEKRFGRVPSLEEIDFQIDAMTRESFLAASGYAEAGKKRKGLISRLLNL